MSLGATPSGAVVTTLQQGTGLASGYTDVGTVSGSVGTSVYEYAASGLTARYLRLVTTSTGGTALASAQIIGKRRTIT